MNPKGGVVLSDISGPEGGAADLAALLGISDRKVRELARQGVFPKVRRGVYDLRESIKAFYESSLRSDLSPTPDDSPLPGLSPLDRVSAPALADILGLSARRVQQLGSEGILSKDGEGYPLSGAIQEYCEYLRGGARSNQDELDVETLRLTRAKADKAEIAVELLVGTTASMDAVEQVWGDMVTVFRSRMLGLPGKMAPLLAGKKDPAEVQSLLAEEVKDGLAELASFDPSEVVNKALPEDLDDDSPSSDSDGVGVGG